MPEKDDAERRLEQVSTGLEKAAIELQNLVATMKLALKDAKAEKQGIQGDVGPEGPQGDVGPEGPVGPKGDKGDRGDAA